MLEQLVIVSLSLAGFLFLLYKWDFILLPWPKWCDFCFLFWIAFVVNIANCLISHKLELILLCFPESIAAYYIFLRIYHGNSIRR